MFSLGAPSHAKLWPSLVSITAQILRLPDGFLVVVKIASKVMSTHPKSLNYLSFCFWLLPLSIISFTVRQTVIYAWFPYQQYMVTLILSMQIDKLGDWWSFWVAAFRDCQVCLDFSTVLEEAHRYTETLNHDKISR